jgi:Flp pilus assembly protein TadG
MRSFDCFSKSRMTSDGQLRRGRGKKVSWIHGLRHLWRRSRSEDGDTVLEFALTFLLFISLTFAVVDFGHLFFVEMEVQHAIQDAARYGSTGNHLPDPNNPGNSLSRATSIINTLKSEAPGVNFSNIQISSLNGGLGSGGGPGDMLTVSTTVNMPLFTPLIAQMFPNGQYTFNANITVKNEPFLPSQTN